MLMRTKMRRALARRAGGWVCPIEFLKGNTAAKAKKAKKKKPDSDAKAGGKKDMEESNEEVVKEEEQEEAAEGKQGGTTVDDDGGDGGYLSQNPFAQLRSASRGKDGPSEGRDGRSRESKRRIEEGVLKLTSEYYIGAWAHEAHAQRLSEYIIMWWWLQVLGQVQGLAFYSTTASFTLPRPVCGWTARHPNKQFSPPLNCTRRLRTAA
eukprot:1190368-Prorocentrum_minimum.AAC.1